MAQNVGTPRIWVDILQWLKAQGQLSQAPNTGAFLTDEDFMDLVGINPTNQLSFPDGDGDNDVLRFESELDFNKIMPNDKNFSMVLGHNFATANSSYKTSIINPDLGLDGFFTVSQNEYINNTSGTTSGIIENDGFSILTGNNAQEAENCNRIQFRFDYQGTGNTYNDNPLKIGSVLYGNYYDMPHSPDLNLKLSYEYDGVKTIQTKGGATLSNATYTKPADWGNSGAWQLDNKQNLRSGRRVWDLSFSYLSDTDLMPVVAATTNLEAGYAEGTPSDENTLLDGTDFFSQVINKTMGGHLPFIFQANKSNNSPDQFAIARFDMNSFSYDQVANNVYNVKLKIREVW